ncbi:MAG: DUF4038 domain-containing protein [Proteobacteria bacterium]|nr:DUF4038 domain-containing protein [Pseudomonadota bacterium]
MVTANAALPLPSLTFSGSPASITRGSVAKLSWAATNATGCTGSGGTFSGARAVSGSLGVTPTTTVNYSLSCTGAGGTVTKTATITVAVATPTLGFTASPASITSGSASKLSWTAINATSCTASGGTFTGTRAVSGSQGVTPAGTASYSLSCTGRGGTVTKTATVTVNAVAAPTLNLSAGPATITSGGASTLNWSATNATGCTASGGTFSGAQAVSGSRSVTPTSTTTYSLSCTGRGGTIRRSISVDVTVASGGCTGPFPLHVEAGKRYLVDCTGKPFLIQGDAAWSLIAQLDQADITTYLDDRKARGFNAILVNLIESTYASKAPANIAGTQPFNTPGDFSTPNDAYFNYAAWVIGQAQQRGIMVLLAPAYLGCCGDGWLARMQGSGGGTSKLYGYGQYLANRFGSYNNILWVEGGDRSPIIGSENDMPLVNAVASGIHSILGNSALQTYHAGRGTSALKAVNPATYAWLSVNTLYTGVVVGDVVSDASAEYARSTMPYFLIEDLYENGNQVLTPGLSRLQAWEANLSGTTGQVMGNSPIWFFCANYYPTGCSGVTPSWQSSLGSDGESSLGFLQSFMTTRSWTSLQPDFSHGFLTADGNTSGYPAVAAVAPGGACAVAYTPGSGTLTFNLGKLAGPSIAVRWYDPTNGIYGATTTLTPGAGSRSFTTPGLNSRNARDWALIFQSQ